MKFHAILPFALLVLKGAAQCWSPGMNYCSDEGATLCECNEGYLVRCELYLVPEVDGEGGESYAMWTVVENCPVPSDGGLQCVGNPGEAYCAA